MWLHSTIKHYIPKEMQALKNQMHKNEKCELKQLMEPLNKPYFLLTFCYASQPVTQKRKRLKLCIDEKLKKAIKLEGTQNLQTHKSKAKNSRAEITNASK